MGWIAGPSIAEEFVYILESKWLVIHRTLLYLRLIDDILYSDREPIDEDRFKNAFSNLMLWTGTVVNFLDLNIKFDRVVRKLNFDLYTKPTNTYGYLLSSSKHPKFNFANVPKSFYIRLKRLCTDYINYLYHCRTLIKMLTAPTSINWSR